MSQGIFSGLSKFIDQMDEQVGEMVQHQHEKQLLQQQQEEQSRAAAAAQLQQLSAVVDPFTQNPVLLSSQQPRSVFQSANAASASSSSLPALSSHRQSLSAEEAHQRHQQLQHDFDAVLERLKATQAESALLHRQLDQAKSQCDAALEKATRLEQQLHAQSELAAQQARAADETQRAAADLAAQLEAAQRDTAAAQARAALAERGLETCRREAAGAKETAAAAQQQLLALQYEEKEKRRDDWRDAAAAADSEMESDTVGMKMELLGLKKALEKLTKERDELVLAVQRSATAATATSIDGANAEQQQQATVDELKKQIKGHVERLEQEAASHRSTRSRLEGMLADKEEEVAILERQLQRMNRPLAAAGAVQSSESTSATAGASTSFSSSGSGNDKNHTAIGAATSSPTSAMASAADWERRAKDLADLVMEKQAALELKRNEAEQWRARYETAQQRLREVELMAAVSSSASSNHHHHQHHHQTVVNIAGDTESAGPGLLQMDSTDITKNYLIQTMMRRGGRGAAALCQTVKVWDGWLQRIVGVMRRNSLMRVSVSMYIGLVHLWVLLLLWVAPTPITTVAGGPSSS